MKWMLCSLLTAAVLSGGVRADEKDKQKPNKPEAAGKMIDLNKLPPDLQKQVLKALESEKAKPEQGKPAIGGKKLPPGLAKKLGNQPEVKGKPAQEKGVKLPPGLAKKSPDHPGVKAFIAAQQNKGKEKPAPQSEKPAPKGKGKGKGGEE